MNTKVYAVGDKVLVRHMGEGRFTGTIVSVGDSKPFWGPQYVVRGPSGEFNAYGNEFVEVGDYDFIF
jgi:hypothetical protein